MNYLIATSLLTLILSGCGRKPASLPETNATAQQLQSTASTSQATVVPTAPKEELAGYIFGVPVPTANYYFAKQVSYMFPHPWEENASVEDRERFIWQALILHFESFRRNVTPSEEELEARINSVLKDQQLSFTRSGDAAAYATWVKETLGEDVELFENQMRYLLQIDQLKDQMRRSFAVTVTEEELHQEFLNEQHHVGGEMVTFDTKEEAQAFYEQVKEPAQWEAMKASGERQVRPVSLMTLEAYVDLWSIPKEQMYAFHAMGLGSVGPPMPFGKQWCVYRLLDKRTGNLADLPQRRASYEEQLKVRKQYEALKRWTDELVASANLKILPLSNPS